MRRSPLPAPRQSNVARSDSPILLLQREINRLFNDGIEGFPDSVSNGAAVLAPTMDMTESDKSVQIEAELPGVDEKDIQVTFEDGILIVKGEKRAVRDGESGGYRMSERVFGSFLRRLNLPTGIDTDKISANFAKGVLTVTVPKLPEAQAKRKRIEVKVAP